MARSIRTRGSILTASRTISWRARSRPIPIRITGLNEWAVYTAGPPADPQPPTALSTSTSNVFPGGPHTRRSGDRFRGHHRRPCDDQEPGAGERDLFRVEHALSATILCSQRRLYTVYKVTALTAAPRNCTNDQNQTGWGTWSIETESTLRDRHDPAERQHVLRRQSLGAGTDERCRG